MSLIIGAAGTAKNTGKTTTTSAVLDKLYEKNIKIGLTSIGYDGEEIDNVTGLPKPRLLLKKGCIVATAQKCLTAGTAGFEILESTGIMTPLGKVVFIKVTDDGLVVIAGPNKSGELKYVLDLLVKKWGSQFVMVDGALNRIAPMVETDGIILATGAAKNTNIGQLVEETRAYYELFNLPQITLEQGKRFYGLYNICLFYEGIDEIKVLNYGSLIDKKTVSDIKNHFNEIKSIYIPALVSEDMLKELNDNVNILWKNKTLVLKDPIKLIAGGNPEGVLKEVTRIFKWGGKVKVLKKLPIIAVSVNPFYPLYRFEKNNYEAGYVNADELASRMKKAIPIPVIDVKKEGLDALIRVINYRI